MSLPLTILILFLTAFLSGLSVYLFNISNKALKLILSYTGAYLFALCVLHLIPDLYKNAEPRIGIYILAGFFLQILIEFFSEGIEHGHIHVHHHSGISFPFAMMAGLSIHSFLEGMPLVHHTGKGTDSSLLMGITLHNIPIAIALMSMFKESGVKNTLSLILLGVFCLCAPTGAWLSSYLGSSLAENYTGFHNAIMGIVIGIFLHISTTILFESNENHRFNLAKFAVILLGAATALLVE